ncbi:MAG: DUF1446 domain-containing protein [Planctomycetota bacterium]|jgi:hypothetical protein|nr:DUF1446 domain-containing protein [Planctomycetota bacterium]MDP6764113.1 DUF1446 domain-containing protein [Planctomycetota bacterium]MDP6989598.1 DUF1446 domain-containing protein [Planctomycetota bacterium]
MSPKPRVRIANCSGFYGDRFGAAREMVEGGAIDYLTGDYLAELTMAILARDRAADPEAGFARTFLAQMEEVLGTCLERGVRVVVNAGGLNPAGLACRLAELSERLGLAPKIAHIAGDEVTERLGALQGAGHELCSMTTGAPLASLERPILCANAYLGARAIVEALDRGADIVVAPRVTDTALVVGPAAHHFSWAADDWDRLASAVVAGHLIECGTQCTGGNYALFEEIEDWGAFGFPFVDVEASGEFTVGKHEGTGGAVSVGTVTAQLLYEIGGIGYVTPDAVARFDTIRLEQTGRDRVRVSGVRGEPAPDHVKVGIVYADGYRWAGELGLAGADFEAKARLCEEQFWRENGGRERFASTRSEVLRVPAVDPDSSTQAVGVLRLAVKDLDAARVGREQFDALVRMALASVPGIVISPDTPRRSTLCAGFWGALLPEGELRVRVFVDGEAIEVAPPALPPPSAASADPPSAARAAAAVAPPTGPTARVPLGRVLGARSGDKGGDASLGFWAADPRTYAWAADFLSSERLAELLGGDRDLALERSLLPNLLAISFLLPGFLAEGAGASLLPDAQAKGLAESVRARAVDVPRALLGAPAAGAD